eukprot:14264121-Ditylum_brightwellii.AAC.1
MVTSNANESVPPAKDVKTSLKGKSYNRVPVTPTMDNGPQEKNITQMCNNYRWRITFPVTDDSEITPRKKVATHSSKYMVRRRRITGFNKQKGSPISTQQFGSVLSSFQEEK